MKQFRTIVEKLPFLLTLGILIVCACFVFLSCGKGPQQKVLDAIAGAFAVNFSDCPNDPCKVILAGGVLQTEPRNVAGKELTAEAWVKVDSDAAKGGILGRLDGAGLILFLNERQPKFAIRRAPIGSEPASCTNLHATSTECIVKAKSAPDTIIPPPAGSPTGTPATIIENPFKLVVDSWYHIAGVLTTQDQSSGPNDCPSYGNESPHLAIYINGDLNNCASSGSSFAGEPGGSMTAGVIGEGTNESVPPLDDPDGFDIGNPDANVDGDELTTATPFDGTIDEVRIWGIARTDEQIVNCMLAELAFNTSVCGRLDQNLLGYFRFNEGKGEIVTEGSGLGSAAKEYRDPSTGQPLDWTSGWVDGVPGLILKD